MPRKKATSEPVVEDPGPEGEPKLDDTIDEAVEEKKPAPFLERNPLDLGTHARVPEG